MISISDVPSAVSIFEIVSRERFSLPFSILEMYCWLQPALCCSLHVEGEGCVSLLGGSHLPSAEYVIDLKNMEAGETRYLKVGTMSSDVADIRFTLDGGSLVIKSGSRELLRVDASVNKIRVILKDRTAYFIDATDM